MKKILLFAMLCASLLSYATDVIITTDDQKLEVKITAVTKDQITYKMPDYLDGPDFTLSTSEINSIIFENGQVKTYDHSKPAPSTGSITTSTASTVSSPKYKLSSDGRSFFRNGVRLENDEYEYFLKNNCPAAYNTYKKGIITESAGFALLSVGLILDITGTIYWYSTNDPYGTLGMLVPSLAFEISSIPCIVVGFKKKNRSAEVYNTSCASKPTATLGISADENGLGLAIRF